jgi:hypothetical protein
MLPRPPRRCVQRFAPVCSHREVAAGFRAALSPQFAARVSRLRKLHEDLFFETSGEFFRVWEMVRPAVPAFRERFVAKTYRANLEKAAQRYEKWIESRSPGHIAAMREFRKQVSAQLAKAI